MKPANLTASFSKPKSELYKASDAYCDMAREQGWVEDSSPLALLKRTLFPDAETEAEKTPHTEYYDKIGVERDAADLVEMRLVEDISAASSLLSDLNVMADTMIVAETEIVRSDVSSFEEALVTARQSRRAFAEAQTILLTKRNWASEQADAAIEAFDDEIDLAKTLADSLAKNWQDESDITS